MEKVTTVQINNHLHLKRIHFKVKKAVVEDESDTSSIQASKTPNDSLVRMRALNRASAQVARLSTHNSFQTISKESNSNVKKPPSKAYLKSKLVTRDQINFWGKADNQSGEEALESRNDRDDSLFIFSLDSKSEDDERVQHRSPSEHYQLPMRSISRRRGRQGTTTRMNVPF